MTQQKTQTQIKRENNDEIIKRKNTRAIKAKTKAGKMIDKYSFILHQIP